MTKFPPELIKFIKPEPEVLQRFNLRRQLFTCGSQPNSLVPQTKITIFEALYIPNNR